MSAEQRLDSSAPMKETVPPHNLDAERSVLGAMMLDDKAVAQAIESLETSSFYIPAHRSIYAAVRHLFENNQAADMVTVAAQLETQGALEKAGGATYLSDLVSSVPTTANIEYYAEIVQDKWLLRELIEAAHKVSVSCYRGEESAAELIEQAEQAVFRVSERRNRGDFEQMKDMMMNVIDHLQSLQNKEGNVTGLDTGFTKLNDLTSGFQPGELVIVAARPAMGKTAFVLNVAEHIATAQNRTVAIFSMEMTARQLVMRMLASHARVEGMRLRRGDLRKQDWMALVQAGTVLRKTDIFIDASPQLTPLEVRARCRRLRAENPNLALVIIDYIQLMDARGRNIDSRQQEIAYISRSLKAMAIELKLPVIAISQLNRESERGREKGTRPQLSQLRESGAIEQDADVVMLLYRPAYYSNDPKYVNRAELILAKQRNGPTGTVHLQFLDNFARFENPPEGFMDGFDDNEP
jgi:replicative DNA helicase